MATVIKAENLSKLYYLGGAKHDSVRDALMSFIKSPTLSKEKSELWALRDVSFSLEEGETLGIVGNNGAGKSTLLKILSRITKPTGGTAELHGRVGSLLEVGTGFHNELTGRENIFLNGAILGMSRSEIEKQFDEIVAFSEIEKFLDTPVKHYSSGMYMRLAFSVAAHLDPEILIVDEVLAVGDTAFQKKCLNKMRDVSQSGRTVLFVSHDMSSITRICNRAIALSGGVIVAEGSSSEVVREYLSASWGMCSERDYTNEAKIPQSEFVRLKNARIINEAGETCGTFDIRKRIGIEMTYEVTRAGQILIPNFQIYNQERAHVFTIQDIGEWSKRAKEPGEYVSRAWLPGNLMSEGSFVVNVAVVTYLPKMIIHFNALDAISFDVYDPMTGDTARGDFVGNMTGAVRPIVDFETEKQSPVKIYV
jgi:lipopolysaccharide transport system ATP-binding protein